MKFLPQCYRESQSDWFRKRGILWHISVVYKRVEEGIKWQGFLHIIQSCSQDSSAVVTIMQNVFSTLKREHPEVCKASFRQDNAGCYHSSRTIPQVVCVDFSDPQGGKGAADRLTATRKSHVRAFVNEGHDVCTANDLRTALLSYGGIEGVRVVAVDRIPETPDTSHTNTGITKLNNFEFSSRDTITCWRAYCVGQGKTIK